MLFFHVFVLLYAFSYVAADSSSQLTLCSVITSWSLGGNMDVIGYKFIPIIILGHLYSRPQSAVGLRRKRGDVTNIENRIIFYSWLVHVLSTMVIETEKDTNEMYMTTCGELQMGRMYVELV
jgi:hypothetical protein